MNYIIYHKVDCDGYCSAALTYQYINTNLEESAELIPFNYGDDLSKIHSIPDGSSVFMVDCSLPREEMIRLNNRTRLVWYDHHVSAIKDMEGINIPGVREVGKAACEIVQEDLFGKRGDGLFAKPSYGKLAAFLLGRYDVWDHTDKEVVPFQYGIRSESWNSDPKHVRWNFLFQDDLRCDELIGPLIKKGEAILSYVQEQNKRLSGGARQGFLKGKRTLFINGGGGSSIFDYCRELEQAEVLCQFFMDKTGDWRVTLFQGPMGKELDVSVLAKSYGGGGHKGAAGFSAKDLSFMSFDI